MKLQIEVTEEEIKSAIERKIRVAIADETNSYKADAYIKEMVKKYWAETVEKLVKQELLNAPKMQEKINFAIEAKLKGQLQALMQVKK
jgi:phage terminase small subunit